MKINVEIIINTCIGLLLYDILLASIGKVLLKYFLDNSETIQKEKKSFQERLKEKQSENLK